VSGHTLDRWIRDRARATPERVAIDHAGGLMTYAELDGRSEGLAAGFLVAGLRRGDRVATLTGNSAEHVVVFFACAKAGLTLLPLNWRLSAVELAYQLDDAGPALLLVEPGLEAAGADAVSAAARAPRMLALGGDEQRELEPGRPAVPPAPVEDDDALLLVYTSGTTGKPKGALLTHANSFWTNLGFDLATGVSGDDVVLQVLPQFHCGGWNVQPLLAWWKGATVVLERGFDAARCLELIAGKGVTSMMGVPAVYQFMAQEPGFGAADLSSLGRAVVGGAPMPEALLETWQARGVEIVQGYGLTEAAPNVLCLPPEDAVRKQGWAGRPYPFVDVALRDPDAGLLTDGPATGELVVRGPNVFAGYWGNPEATEAAFFDGWLLTGDVAERDAEGYYRICGRVKDMYISGGENVYPAEVEGVLHAHAAVADAAVVGVPDERWGEAGVAFVVLEPGEAAGIGAEELRAWCTARLAKYKVPREVRFVEVLPRSAMNKVLKTELVAQLEREPVA
jgi:fatty-acyl-CoA synthase